MRFDDLFDDLETQLERELTSEEEDLGVEEERLRLGRLTVRDRLVALHESGAERVAITLTSGQRLALKPQTFGRDWLAGEVIGGAARGQCLVPLGAVGAVSLTTGQVAPSLESVRDARAEASLSMRLGLPFVLRDLCRRRKALDLVLAATTLHGTIDRVGRDHLDLAVHEPDTPRRASAVSEILLVPLTSLLLVSY